MRLSYVWFSIALALYVPPDQAFAQHFMDQWPDCPAMREHASKNCPADNTLLWTDCPKTWPLDDRITLDGSALLSGVNMEPFLDRYQMQEGERTVRVECVYGHHDKKYRYKYHLTIEPPLPIVQCGTHGNTLGCSSPKPDGPVPATQIYIAEPVTENSTLAGVGLGWTEQEVEVYAKANDYSITWVKEEIVPGKVYSHYEGLYRPGIALTLVYDNNNPRRTKEIILNAGWQDADAENLYTQSVRQFGLGWHWQYGIQGRNDPKYVWTSEDENIVVEFWPDYRPKAPASLHLFDKRKLTPSDHTR